METRDSDALTIPAEIIHMIAKKRPNKGLALVCRDVAADHRKIWRKRDKLLAHLTRVLKPPPGFFSKHTILHRLMHYCSQEDLVQHTFRCEREWNKKLCMDKEELEWMLSRVRCGFSIEGMNVRNPGRFVRYLEEIRSQSYELSELEASLLMSISFVYGKEAVEIADSVLGSPEFNFHAIMSASRDFGSLEDIDPQSVLDRKNRHQKDSYYSLWDFFDPQTIPEVVPTYKTYARLLHLSISCHGWNPADIVYNEYHKGRPDICEEFFKIRVEKDQDETRVEDSVPYLPTHGEVALGNILCSDRPASLAEELVGLGVCGIETDLVIEFLWTNSLVKRNEREQTAACWEAGSCT